ncbi:MAG: hypothetical protein JF588_10605 [Caulobacterales bacterium]|nr:hypothetical protein [Caulobacterales bacterium]
MTTYDYADLYEAQYRPGRRLRRAVARILWVALFLVRPGLALDIWRGR